jgi:putative inorganic carbon (HCO3(-)) transporter
VDRIRDKSDSMSRIYGESPLTRGTFLLGMVVAISVLAGLFASNVPMKFVFGIVGGIALFIIIYRNIQFGIVLFLILNLIIPQAGPGINLGIKAPMMPGERGLHFNLHEIVMAMVLVAWVIQVIIEVLTDNEKEKEGLPLIFRFFHRLFFRVKSPLTWPVIIYILISILSCFVGLMHGASIFLVIFRWVRTAAFAYMFFVILNNVKTRRQFQQLVLVILICSFLVAAFGLLQKIMGQTWTEMITAKYLGHYLGYPSDVNYVAGAGATQVYRVSSTFVHPNILGGYLVFTLPFFVSCLWVYRRLWMRLLLLAGLATNLACLFYTGSRAGWIAAALIILTYGVLGFFDRRMVLAVATVLLILIMIVVLFKPPDFLRQRFVSQSAKDATTGRLMTYKLALDFFMENPIFGLGTGMEGQKIVENNIRKTWASVENVYLTYLVSGGLVGLASFLMLLIFYWAILLWARNQSEDDDLVHFSAEAFIMAMIGLAVANLFGAWLLFAVPMITIFWFLMGAGASLYNIFREGKEGY